MDKEKFEKDQEADFTGFSEDKSAKAVDRPVDLTAGQWITVPVPVKTVFLKKKIIKTNTKLK